MSDDLQLQIAREALWRAVDAVAGQAETLAAEIEAGTLTDLGSPNALRLLAAVARLSARDPMGAGGNA